MGVLLFHHLILFYVYTFFYAECSETAAQPSNPESLHVCKIKENCLSEENHLVPDMN